MTVREILHVGNPLLREVSREIPPDEVRKADVQQLIDDLIETMRHANGAGIAAPQIGELVRIATIEVTHNPRYPYKPPIPLTVVINPVVTPLDDELVEINEGCLSVPNLRGVVPRFAEVRVTGWDREGQPFERIARGLTAGTFQHEKDHLDGMLFIDRVSKLKRDLYVRRRKKQLRREQEEREAAGHHGG